MTHPEQNVWHDWPPPGQFTETVVTVGVFDGFHQGHAALTASAVATGRENGLPVVLVTFDPHPLAVLAPKRAPLQLLPVEERIEYALSLGVDGVVVLPFTHELAHQTAQEFVERGLVATLGMRHLVVGANFACGRGGEGDVAYLRRSGQRTGFSVRTLDLVSVGERVCSSTEVRRAVERGDSVTARKLLGRHLPVVDRAATSGPDARPERPTS